MQKKKSWFKLKQYPHIGLPIFPQERQKVENFVHNDDKIAHYAFLPLIRRMQVSHRYKKQSDGKKRKRTKIRNISYATHLDSLIYSYYASILSKKYESYLNREKLINNVIAYRSISKKSKAGKCNIDFAKDAFDYIKSLPKNSSYTVIVSDITSFFDNINYKLLKKAWKFICSEEHLNDAEYNVYKSVIKYSYVYEEDLFNLFKDNIICSNKSRTTNCKKSIKKICYLRDNNAVAFCEKKDITKIRSAKLIHPNKTTYLGENVGIPQGLPISAVLANMYMYNFDLNVNRFICSIGGYYRRYSDDIIVVCPENKKNECYDKLIEEIKAIKLELSKDKTKFFDIFINDKSEISILMNRVPSVIEYLGFSFDGKRILIKNKGISQYYQKMNKSVKRQIWYALHMNNMTKGILFENKLLFRYTPTGSKRHYIYKKSKSENKFVKTGRKSYGNYWTYVLKSSQICNSEIIKHQLHRNKAILKKKIKSAKEDVYKTLIKRQWREYFKYHKVYTLHVKR